MLDYSVETMVAAFRPERIGGLAHFIVIGRGETRIPKEVVPFCKGLLEQGHLLICLWSYAIPTIINWPIFIWSIYLHWLKIGVKGFL